MTSQSPAPVKMTARSAILSALLGTHPARARSQQIVEIGGALGLRESAVRVALTRLVSTGDLVRDDGEYALSDRLLARQERQDRAIVAPPAQWSGKWRIAVAPMNDEPIAGAVPLRDAFDFLKFARLRDGVWTRPDNTGDLALDLADRVSMFSAVPDEPPVELAARLFRPDLWAADAQALLATFVTTTPVAQRFELAAAMVGHLLDDPLLPPDLLGASRVDWPGDRLRAVYQGFREEFADFVGTAIN